MSAPRPCSVREKVPAVVSDSANHAKAATAAVMIAASAHSRKGALFFIKHWPQMSTGTSFIDLKTICVGKVTYQREAYWNPVAATFVKEGRRQARRAEPSASTPPKMPSGFFCTNFTTSAAKSVAMMRLMATKKEIEGNCAAMLSF